MDEGQHRRGPDNFDAAAGCQEAIQTLYNFLDGELTDRRRYEIQLHLEECSPCLEAFDFEAELKIIIARKLPGPGPGQTCGTVSRGLVEGIQGRPWQRTQ